MTTNNFLVPSRIMPTATTKQTSEQAWKRTRDLTTPKISAIKMKERVVIELLRKEG